MSPKMRYLLDGIRAHALANYNTAGWDLVIETTTEADLIDQLGHDMWTMKQAIRIAHSHVKDYAEYRDEIASTAF